MNKGLLIVVLAICLSNITSLYLKGIPVYHYRNGSGDYQFSVIPPKGIQLSDLEASYKNYLAKNNITNEDQLYRTFEKNPFKFWNWYDYLFNEVYQYPYLGAK